MANDKSTPSRPLPNLDELDTAPFWAATREHEFRFQVCASCGTVVWHPRRHCTGCVDGSLEWHVSQGEGTIYSFSIVRQSYHPFFRNKVPYVVALVDLDEGPRFLTNVIVDDPEGDVHIGQRVAISWEDHETLAIPLVTPSV